jgi:hypothetical protein
VRVCFQIAALMCLALPFCAGCGRAPRTYAIYTVSLDEPRGSLVTTSVQEVPDAEACDIMVSAAKKGIAEGNPNGQTSGSKAACVTELPAELQSVQEGKRLPGAYIISISSPETMTFYSITRGFSIENPEEVCRHLTSVMRDHLHDALAKLNCEYPSEVQVVRPGT